MHYLEKLLHDPEVAAPIVPCRLGVDAAEWFKQFEDALSQAGDKDRAPVQAWPTAARTMRSALPTEEGGVDKSQPSLRNLMRFRIVPIRYFPPLIDRNMGIVYQMLMEKFTSPFFSLLFEPQQPRDALLRGHFNEASRVLTTMRKDTMDQKARAEGIPDLMARVGEALRPILEAQAKLQPAERQRDANKDELRAIRDNALREGRGWLDILIEGAASIPLGQEVNYQLALAKHEQAERLQLRVEFPNRAEKTAVGDADEARKAWLNAADWWTTYLREYPDAPASSSARFNACHARLMLGERDAALDLLRDHSKLTALEKVGRITRTRQLEKQK
jgi:hypothetical protein